jgi:hypothetical protein
MLVVMNLLRKGVWTYRKTDNRMNELMVMVLFV